MQIKKVLSIIVFFVMVVSLFSGIGISLLPDMVVSAEQTSGTINIAEAAQVGSLDVSSQTTGDYLRAAASGTNTPFSTDASSYFSGGTYFNAGTPDLGSGRQFFFKFTFPSNNEVPRNILSNVTISLTAQSAHSYCHYYSTLTLFSVSDTAPMGEGGTANQYITTTTKNQYSYTGDESGVKVESGKIFAGDTNRKFTFDVTNYIKNNPDQTVFAFTGLMAKGMVTFYGTNSTAEYKPVVTYTADTAQSVKDDLKTINLDQAGVISGLKLTSSTPSFTLPKTINDTAIIWSAESGSGISVDGEGNGTYTPVATSQFYTLTATGTKGENTVTREFKILCLNTSAEPASDNLLAHYTFQEFTNSGSTVPDVSGNGNDAQVINDNASLAINKKGIIEFPGYPSSNQLGAALKFQDSFNRKITDNYTFSMWVKPASSSLYNYANGVRFIDLGYRLNTGIKDANITSTNSLFFQYVPGSNNTIYLRDRAKGTATDSYAQGTYDLQDKWFLATIVYKNGTTTLYINGTSVLTTTAGSAAEMRSLGWLGNTSGNANGLFIGRTQWFSDSGQMVSNPDFKGKMSDIRVYSRDLESEEIESLYQNTAPEKLEISNTTVNAGENGVDVSFDAFNTLEDNKEISVIVAAYSNGVNPQLMGVKEVKQAIAYNNSSLKTPYTVHVDTPASGEYTLKAFIWDDLNSMKPYVQELNATN